MLSAFDYPMEKALYKLTIIIINIKCFKLFVGKYIDIYVVEEPFTKEEEKELLEEEG